LGRYLWEPKASWEEVCRRIEGKWAVGKRAVGGRVDRRWMEVDLEVEHTAEVIQEIVPEELVMQGIVPEEVAWNERQSSGGAESDVTREPNQL
jgi:hypothetical protein